MAIGCDLIGSKMSMAASKTLDLELTPVGVKASSKNSGRIMIIPFANIKGIEMMKESAPCVAGDETLEAPKRSRQTKSQ